MRGSTRPSTTRNERDAWSLFPATDDSEGPCNPVAIALTHRTMRGMNHGAESEPLLVNCTGRPQFVLAGTKVVELLQASPPVVIEDSSESSGRSSTIRFQTGSGDGAATLVETDLKVCFTQEPPVVDGVVWLVDDHVLAQFAHRQDFVRPVHYTRVTRTGLELASRDSELLRDAVLVLDAVSHMPTTVGPDAVRLSDLTTETDVPLLRESSWSGLLCDDLESETRAFNLGTTVGDQ